MLHFVGVWLEYLISGAGLCVVQIKIYDISWVGGHFQFGLELLLFDEILFGVVA